tara:strand:- start:1302 stop:1925 length:624 start_codon:yes stop_codon:yes gene_type:complete
MDLNFIIFGFITGLSFIIVIGPQNLFVIEQGLKKQFVFFVCFFCSISDLLLIFSGIFLFHYFETYFTQTIIFLLNCFLILFLANFIRLKINDILKNNIVQFKNQNLIFKSVLINLFGFTFLNPHVYSDTVFIFGNLTKSFTIIEKINFGTGASLSSFIFFYSIGYLSKYFSRYVNIPEIWKYLNIMIILFMIFLILFILLNTFSFFQ